MQFFWFTRQTTRVNGELSRNDFRFEQAHVFDAYTCTGASAIANAVTSHVDGIHQEHSTRFSVGCSICQSAASSGDALLPRAHPQDLHFCEPELPLEACSQAEDLTNYATRMLRTLQLRGTLRGAGARSAPSRELHKTSPTPTLWQVSESLDHFQVCS